MKSIIPVKLPLSSEKFESFCAEIIAIYDLPDNDSVRQTIATMIMHLGPLETHKPYSYFGRAIEKSLANAAAYDFMKAAKERQEKELENG